MMMGKHQANRPCPIKYQSTTTEVIGACLVVAGFFAVLLLPVFEASNWLARKLFQREKA